MQENSRVYAERVAFLADRMSILMTVCIVKYGGSLNPWFRDSFYDEEIGAEIREMEEYGVAKQIVRNMLAREIGRSSAVNHKSANP